MTRQGPQSKYRARSRILWYVSPPSPNPQPTKPLIAPPFTVYDEQASLLYLTIFQVFSIWFIPFHRAPVRLVTVLHLTPARANGDGTPPPPYDAAQEKRQAVREGNEPSYAAVTSGSSGTSASQTQEQPKKGQEQQNKDQGQQKKEQEQQKKEEDKPTSSSSAAGKAPASGSGSGSGSGSSSGSKAATVTRYVIEKQQDLYQVNEFVKFVTLTPLLPIINGFLQILATLACWAGAVTLGPVMNAVWPAGKKEKD